MDGGDHGFNPMNVYDYEISLFSYKDVIVELTRQKLQILKKLIKLIYIYIYDHLFTKIQDYFGGSDTAYI